MSDKGGTFIFPFAFGIGMPVGLDGEGLMSKRSSRWKKRSRSNGGGDIVVSGMRVRTRDQITLGLSKGPQGRSL
jgi:hypothetical protein